ncbi:AAA family ATPase [Halosolutus gelatinilyticus]|uniref:AAA family ATPase n=1 Tax=Halosolutus gelatinilyticus TaxID=2931975 RepID=UPI001FF14957|nr:ATP-binding protein [Halosolutus gelatinilyticus]
MIPTRIAVDETLPAHGPIRYALAEYAAANVGEDAAISRLHRVFYPVFRVEYAYEAPGRLPWGDSSERAVALLDGLWADNHAALQRYRSPTSSTVDISLEGYDFGLDETGLGRSVLLEFRVPTRRAKRLLPERFDDLRQSAAFDDPRSVTDSFADTLRETFGLPDGVDAGTFDEVVDVTRLYLPFWVAEVYRPDERDLIGVVRSVEDVRTDGSTSHDWLASFLREDTERLARYAHTTIRRTIDGTPTADESATDETGAASTDGDAAVADGTAAATERESGSAAEADSPRDEADSTPGDEPIQPEEADLEAAYLVDQSPDRCFADVGGMADLESTLRRSVIGPVERPEQFREYGLDPVSGVLLYGPPGCGKTYVAAALAGELDYAFLEVTPADLSSKYMGKPAENVRDVFAIAKANQPCVLFLDEIDAIASAREEQSSTSERGMVNQLLTELEDVAGSEVLVLAATNLLDDVDDAILRTGRFDERIEVPPPDAPARREILEIHLEGRPLADDRSLSPVVDRTAGYASSDLEYVVADAARRALRDGSPIETADLLAAVDDTDSSVPDWGGSAVGDGRTVTQPDGVDLSARSLVATDTGRTFADVGGMGDLKARLRETVVDPFENADRYAEYGLAATNGVLLYGPPGCGKTYLAGALAGELDVAFLEVTPADLTSKWMGKPAQNVADLFAIARANQPCVVFLDEIDAVAGRRAGRDGASQRQMVNQFLTELETVDGDDVVVVAATNRIDDVDDAILRSGRFDERIEVPPPDAPARREILQVHLADRPLADGVSWTAPVEYTAGYAASDLALLADNAARKAMQAGDLVRERHLLEAVSETRSSIETDGNAAGAGRPVESWYR